MKMKRNDTRILPIFAAPPGHVPHFQDTLMPFAILLQDPTTQMHADIVARISLAPGQDPKSQ
jgi:hypothetical protein